VIRRWRLWRWERRARKALNDPRNMCRVAVLDDPEDKP
jgi:hypothetical protein